MNDTSFANAVAAVRALENSLLTAADIDRLLAVSRSSELADVLVSTGKYSSADMSDVNALIDNELEKTWDFICGYAPDSDALRIMLYRNDFHNLKAALKSLIMNADPFRYFITPTNLDLGELWTCVRSKDFSSLPKNMADAAAETYSVLTETLDGQLADAYIDCAALDAMQRDAARCGSPFMRKYADLITVGCDIKTAYRCAKMGKSQAFAEKAVCGSGELDKASVVSACTRGTESFLSWLSSTAYSEAADMLRESPAAFEKYSDDLIMSLANEARLSAFGIEPLAAYFIAKEAEIRDLRILVTCKECGASNDIITERMRRLYV